MADTAPDISILTVTTLFPNPVVPSHGVFVETRLRALVATGRVAARVIAPVAWVPAGLERYPGAAGLRRVPSTELRHGLHVAHPRYVVVPKLGMHAAPALLAASMLRAVRREIAAGHRVDLLDAHYFYPDGVAAVWVARRLGLPVVITARGTDLTLIPDYPLPRRMIEWAARQADGVITVCAALKERAVTLGMRADHIRVLRNGVDLALFRRGDRADQRARLGLSRFTLVSVGHLIERKGHHHVIAALADLPETDLLIAGDGPERVALEALARTIGVADRVRFLGRLAQDALRDLYGAADALVLASSREGWANVLLEAMACGTPVVASAVWGTPEVVSAPEAGVLMDDLSAAGVVRGVARLRADPPDRSATRRYAEGFDWQPTSQGQIDLFAEILARRQRVAHPKRAA